MFNCTYHPSGGDCVRCQQKNKVMVPLKIAEDVVWLWNKGLMDLPEMPEPVKERYRESVRILNEEITKLKK